MFKTISLNVTSMTFLLNSPTRKALCVLGYYYSYSSLDQSSLKQGGDKAVVHFFIVRLWPRQNFRHVVEDELAKEGVIYGSNQQ